ncbi:cysteine-rich venom protein TRI1-like [Stegodyphus dumicola]|uniref:cysteine-rich venom protein TRI1-like n=1 Tax=Stegodyphus dumicola TaxID=202533 RepID=UPI0015A90A08|nr:cysteine-rich venom protein TRI1-like [Stegodyphus dumicola]
MALELLFSCLFFSSVIAQKISEPNFYDDKDDQQNLDYFSNIQSYPIFDPVLEDENSDFELSDIIALSEAAVDYDIDIYTKEQKQYIVHLHNLYRSNQTEPIPKGSDLTYMEYNNTLEWTAYLYLKKCQFKHGFSEKDNMTTKQGQNLYWGWSTDINRYMWMYYEEYKWYFFNNLTCMQPYPQYMCGHFTQLFWAESLHVGCARRSYCFPTSRKKIIANCHYIPKGNYQGPAFEPYRYGWPCTRCRFSDGNLCHKNLCVDKRICKEYKLDCSCQTACKNCVKPNPKTCKCEPCKYGWDYEDCSFPCIDAIDASSFPRLCYKNSEYKYNKSCDKLPGLKWCRKFCGRCFALDLTKKDKLCCGGKICEKYYVLDERTCECVLDCPSPLCLFPPSTTPSPLRNAASVNVPIGNNFSKILCFIITSSLFF